MSTERVIDRALRVARTLGAHRRPVALADLRQGYWDAYPEATAGQSADSFDATISFHTVNMQSRFPKPGDPGAQAPWKTEPLFARVGPGEYRLLSDAELSRFRELLEAGDPRVLASEYDAVQVLGS